MILVPPLSVHIVVVLELGDDCRKKLATESIIICIRHFEM